MVSAFGCLQGQVSPSGGSAHAGDPSGGPVVPPWVGLGMGLFCPVGSRNAEDPSGGSVVPRLTGGMDCQSPASSGRDSADLEGLSYLELITACSRCDLSTAGDVIALRRHLAEYPAHPSPSGVGSHEEEELRWWLGTAGAGWLRVPFSFVEMQPFLESRGFWRILFVFTPWLWLSRDGVR